MTDFVAELRSLRTQAFRRLLHNADFRVLLALDRALADLEDPSADLTMVGEDDVLPTLRQTAATGTAAEKKSADEPPGVGQDLFAEEAASAEEAQRLLDEVERARAGAIAAHRAVMESGRDTEDAPPAEPAASNGSDAEHLNGTTATTAGDEDPLTSIFTGPMPEAAPAPSEDTPIERLTPRDDAYEAALNRLNTLIERASNQLRATSG